MNDSAKNHLARIMRAYNPDNDVIVGQPNVNWVDEALVATLELLLDRVCYLETKLTELQSGDNHETN